MRQPLLVALALALGVATLSAQRVQRRLYITAIDGSGAPVVDLTAADFELRENGVRRDVLRATRANAPMRIVLLVDTSSAIAPFLTSMRAGLKTFLEALPGEHEIALISTGGQIRIRQAVTADRARLQTAAGQVTSDGSANSLIETMIEADRRFLNAAPGQWPVFVIVTTDNVAADPEPNANRLNRFISDFFSRGGTAHAIALHGRGGGITTDFVATVVEKTGGYHDTMAIANMLPEKMKLLAAHIDANHTAMSNWYEIDFIGDGGSARVQATVRRPGVTLQAATRRPF